MVQIDLIVLYEIIKYYAYIYLKYDFVLLYDFSFCVA